MTEQLRLTGSEKVLEIGTGSGYQTAVLSRLAAKVFSIEIRPELAAQAKERLAASGSANVEIRAADGYFGWPDEAPFDGILVTAAPEKVPEPLLAQLAPGGRMVIPVGGFFQELRVIERTPDGLRERNVLGVRFVPFVGEAERHRPDAEPR
jgi:protein-L-isoaspartate(D-aspartate) O-methyltransferase